MATVSAWVGHRWLPLLVFREGIGRCGMGDGGSTLSRLYISLAFPFFFSCFLVPSRLDISGGSLGFGPSLGGPGDELIFLVSFLTDAADDGPEGGRQFIAAGGVFS